MLNIRPATEQDIVFITEIYNDAIINTTATFDTDPKSIEDRMNWFLNHNEMNPVIVATIKNEVVGFASLSKWSERSAYDTTAEVSVYVKVNFRDQGIGKKLLEVITIEGGNAGLHTIISRITEGNEKSLHLHEILGYEHIGVLKEVGKKFDRFLNVHMLQKVF